MNDHAFRTSKAKLDHQLMSANPIVPLFLSLDLYRAFVENDLISSDITRDADGAATGLIGRYGLHDLGALPSLPPGDFWIADVGTDIIETMMRQVHSAGE